MKSALSYLTVALILNACGSTPVPKSIVTEGVLQNVAECTNWLFLKKDGYKIDFISALKQNRDTLTTHAQIDRTVQSMILDNPNIPGIQQEPLYNSYLTCIKATRKTYDNSRSRES